MEIAQTYLSNIKFSRREREKAIADANRSHGEASRSGYDPFKRQERNPTLTDNGKGKQPLSVAISDPASLTPTGAANDVHRRLFAEGKTESGDTLPGTEGTVLDATIDSHTRRAILPLVTDPAKIIPPIHLSTSTDTAGGGGRRTRTRTYSNSRKNQDGSAFAASLQPGASRSRPVHFNVAVHRTNHYRMLYSTPELGLLGMSSLIKYDPRREKNIDAKPGAFSDKYSRVCRDGVAVYNEIERRLMKKEGMRYTNYLEGSVRFDGTDPNGVAGPNLVEYDPLYLDDPDIRAGHDRTIMTLEGFVASVIPFIKPKDLKAELNQQFQQKHPWIDPNLTLSKIRNLKRRLLDVGVDSDLDLTTIGMSYAYFEKLVLAQVVREKNRKVIAGACLVIAAKFNEPTRSPEQQVVLLEELEDMFDIKTQYFLEVEMAVFCDLHFELHLPREEVYPHLQRITQVIDTSDEYEPLVKTAQALVATMHLQQAAQG